MKIKGSFEFGAAYVIANIKSTYLNIFAPLRFLIDTGASRTTLADKDVVKLGVSYEKLKKLKEGVIGIGGEVETFIIKDAELWFKSEDKIHKEKLDIFVLKHKEMDEKVKKLPSLLGRDILNKYTLTYSASKNLIEITD